MIFAVVGLTMLLSACSSASSPATSNLRTQVSASDAAALHGLLATPTGEALFVQWTRTQNRLTGTMQLAYLSSNGAHLDSQSGAISGTQAGSSVTLSVGKLFSSSALSGSFEGSNLLLSIPEPNGSLAAIRFSSSSVAQYNAALIPLRISAEQTSALDQYVQENEVQSQGETATFLASRPFRVGKATDVVVTFETESSGSFDEAVVQSLSWQQGFWELLASFSVAGVYPRGLVAMELASDLNQ